MSGPALAMSNDATPTTPLRHMLWLAWVLSAIYLGVGALVALLNRVTHGSFHALAIALDQFSSAFLQLAHLWDPLVRALATGQLATWQVRLVLMGLSVALIFLYALTLGTALNLLRAFWLRRAPR